MEVAPNRHELGRARMAILLTKKPKAVEPRPLIQRLGVMRDEDELAVAFFDSLFGGEKPWLNLAEGDKAR